MDHAELEPCEDGPVQLNARKTLLNGVVQLEPLNEHGDIEDGTLSLEQIEPEIRGVCLILLDTAEQFEYMYNIDKKVGEGTYSNVYLVTDFVSKESKAAKFIKYKKTSEYEDILKEMNILNCFKHPNLPVMSAAYEIPKHVIMIMDYYSGRELDERVTSSEQDCIIYMRQMCDALSFIHSMHIVHLDLKPENVMFLSPSSKTIKIVDFGLAKILTLDIGLRPDWGPTEFMPPEWNEDFKTILGPEADVWSAGVLCYLLLLGSTPFTGKNLKETRVNTIKVAYSFEDECFEDISQDAKDFISSILKKNKDERPTAAKCLQHKWFNL